MRYGEEVLYSSGKPQISIYHSTVSCGDRPSVPHHHTECELALITGGNGIYTVGNKTYDFHAGDVFLFNGDEIHCITRVDDGERFDVLNIHFEPRLVWAQDGFSSTGLLKIFFSRSGQFENRIERENPVTARIAELIRDIETELHEKRFEYPISARGKLSEILILLSREYGYIDTAPAAGYEHTAKKLSSVMNYIEENLSSEIRLCDIAAKCGMNKTYFCSVFKRYNGISPFDYITIKRVEKAVELLKTTDRKKIDIAAECGFNSMSNFYKAFSKITGKKPGDF